MARRTQPIDLYPFDREEYITGLDQTIMEIASLKRQLEESIEDFYDDIQNPPEVPMDNLQKMLGSLTKLELILRGLRSLI